MTYQPPCAHCGESVAPDVDHVRVNAAWIHLEDRDDREDYYLHQECAFEVFDDWDQPP